MIFRQILKKSYSMLPNFFRHTISPFVSIIFLLTLFVACEQEQNINSAVIESIEEEPKEVTIAAEKIAATVNDEYDPIPAATNEIESREDLSIIDYLSFKPELSLFSEALNRFPTLVEALSDPNTQITTLAATNEAFMEYLNENGFNSLAEVSQTTLGGVIVNHILERGERIAVIEFQEIEPTFAMNSSGLSIEVTGQETAIINGEVEIVRANQFVGRSIVHYVDGVITIDAPARFTVTIENVGTPRPYFLSGVFNTPVGADTPAPIFPGDAYEFTFQAGPNVLPNDGGTRLSLVTMFVQSNDLFFAPDEAGIRLFDENGTALGSNGAADVTDQILLWDAGTEVNTITGTASQKPQQDPAAEDVGTDENGVVIEITNNTDGLNTFPDVAEVIKVTITNSNDTEFTVRIENLSDAMTISVPAMGDDATAPVPMSPGVWIVHTSDSPFFTAGEAASEGIENIAEDGFSQVEAMRATENTGLTVPFSPGVWAIHRIGTRPLFSRGNPDFGNGLEAIAEDGNPEALANALSNNSDVGQSAIFNTPVGSDTPAPIGSGGRYQFSFTAIPGDRLSLATMFVQSNDWIYSFNEIGLPLFDGNMPISGDFTNSIRFYDVGTEIDEFPGAGLNQVIRQAAANTGAVDADNTVRRVDAVPDNVPRKNELIRVTIEVE